VAFPEVGGLDAIVDVVGVCAALEVLGIDRVYASPVALGLDAGRAGGLIAGAHGPLPNPVPAALGLLAGAPVYGVDVPVELTTPTGAALLAGLADGYGPLPAMTVTAVGYGAGRRELAHRPNLVQVVLGTAPVDADATPAATPGQPVVLLEANVDDATGETLAHAVAELLAAGAHDAWITPIVMKKGRPAHTVHALVDPALAPQLAAVLGAETGTFGLRGQTLQRWPAARHVEVVAVDGQPVRVKVGPGRIKAEHDDAVRAARALGRPAREVAARAESAWRESQ
jgi:pyridinium-3,5-bisthiocarboxylic acid mononucleotide nickel chelatase